MELKDTIALMTSDDYCDRFKAEYYQTKIRLENLRTLLEKYKAGTLPFEPSSPYSLLLEQRIYMDDYFMILKRRVKIEGIDLEEE